MKILFISTVPVFPPTDGVRIPPANYIRGLAQSHEVDFLLLENSAQPPYREEELQATREQTQRLGRVAIRRGSKATGLVRELLCLGTYYGYWHLKGPIPEEIAHTEYDAVFVCTIAAAGIFSRATHQALVSGSPLWIAAISDVHSLVIARLALNASKNHRLLTRTIQRYVFAARSNLLAKSETKMLLSFDYHLVQTEKEVEWIKEKGGQEVHGRSVQISNAVNDQLFALPVERYHKSIVFVGALSALYAGRFEWFIHSVWKQAQRRDPELALTAVGRDASASLQETMRQHGVSYVSFVEDLNDIYREHDFLIAPIFKGYGLINKVVEAMASGCLVIGDATAFNGIPEFVAGEHGFVANTEEEFIRVLADEIDDPVRLNKMRVSARRLLEKHFRWQQRIEIIEQKILCS